MLRERLLGTSAGYGAFRRAIDADRHMRTIVDEYVCPQPGWRVLDVGCGNADLAGMLPPGTVYVGIDSNTDYVARARTRRLDVREVAVADLRGLDEQPFDAIVAIGLLHHLPAASAQELLSDCRSMLADGGIVVTVDPVRHPRQPALSRWLMAMDRGAHIRDANGYRDLVGSEFEQCEQTVRRDLLSFPYAHCIMQLRAG